MYRKTYVEVNLDNLTANIKEIKKTYPNYDYYFGVVKGNAYGHGIEVVNTLINAGINYIAAATLDECLNIRKINNKIPILCLQPIHPKEVVICAKNNIIRKKLLIYTKKSIDGLIRSPIILSMKR